MQKTANSKMRRRTMVVLTFFLIFGFALIIGRLFYIQVVRGEMYQERALQQQTRANTVNAQRGSIFDRNMNVLVQSATAWNVCISPADIKEEDIDKLATDLSVILDIKKEKIVEAANDRKVYYKCIKYRVDANLREQVLQYIETSGANGVFFDIDTKRYYKYGSLASTVLGFTDFDGQGAYGLESYYNSVLSGKTGMVVSTKDALGSDMPFKNQQLFPAQDGNSLVLTIDESIQHFLERNLETAIIEHNIGNRAAGIVMNVKTGEILAMASKPDFDPNQPYILQDPNAAALLATYQEGTEDYSKMQTKLWYNQWRNKAISDPYEPGSVFKIITAATALDNKLVSVTGEGFFCDGTIEVSGVTYHCWKHQGHGQQTFINGMQNSCNPVFITVGQRIGAHTFYNYMDNFGLGEVTGIDLPGEADSIRQSYEVLSKPGMIELSSTSFGQTFKVTPLQLITAVSASVNGGKLMQPYVVSQVLDPQGNVIETTEPVVKRQVVSEETSETIRMLTEAVVDDGSGRYAAIPGYRIGGKTGTSEKKDQGEDKNILSFVGFAPMDDPTYAVLVMLDEPELDDVFGSVIAAPVVGAVLQEMLPYVGLEPQFTQEELSQREINVPNLVGSKPHDAQAKLTTNGLKTRFVGNGPTVISQIPQSGQKITQGGTVILYTEEGAISSDLTVPSVVGMTAQEANKTLVGAGLNIELRGEITDGVPTMVQEQWPLAGTVAITGDVVVVTLVRKPEEAAPVIEIPEDIPHAVGTETEGDPASDNGAQEEELETVPGEIEYEDEMNIFDELDSPDDLEVDWGETEYEE